MEDQRQLVIDRIETLFRELLHLQHLEEQMAESLIAQETSHIMTNAPQMGLRLSDALQSAGWTTQWSTQDELHYCHQAMMRTCCALALHMHASR